MIEQDIGFLNELERIIEDRISTGADDSYTVQLVNSGDKRVAQKVGEEAVELILASMAGDREELIDESADLVYHLLVLLALKDLSLADVAGRLRQRHAEA